MKNDRLDMFNTEFDDYFDETGYELRSSYYENEILREIEEDFNCKYEDLNFNLKNEILTELLNLSNRKAELYKRQMVGEYRKAKAVKILRDLNKHDRIYQQKNINKITYQDTRICENQPGIVFRNRNIDKGDYWGTAEFDEEEGFVLEL